ncbi:MAG TPA: lysylphosphatidylglycerol synthase domain-containing protein [Solirubrobacteraceae bacterium]|nr:lysylphosphatidylglycerol synthase domain-containing protein [Solirubrobacteraceae bacterium]
MAVLGVLIVTLLAAVPGLDGVADVLRHARLPWVAAAIAFEILSCVGFILAFQLVFARAPLRFAARLALAEIGFGAAISVGGAGGAALGVWVLRARGVPARRAVERSATLFLLTSAVNVIVLTVFSTGLATGILPGPGDPLLSVVPAGVGAGVLCFFLALPRWAARAAHRRDDDGKLATTLLGLASSITSTKRILLTPNWRLVGAFAYLLCDIGVMWACFTALGHPPPFAAIVLAYQIGYLANIIPVPGGLGVLDGGLVGMLVLYGSTATTATAVVLAYHAIALWIPALWGTVAYTLLRRSLTQPLVPRDAPRHG